MSKVVTRFAPSPTGMLHIGSAKMALLNYLYARNKGGKYLLRIEDTDKTRSTKEAEEEILASLKWLGLEADADPVYQSSREIRHKEVADELVKSGQAYYCYATKEELDELREEASKKNQRFKYDRRWRDRDPKEAPEGVDPVVRLKAPLTGSTEFEDLVQGKIVINNEEQDDLIILRSDGTPTYMLAVIVDDYDMGVTHVIRGDDHLTNTSKQILLYQALGWQVPTFAHVPLIYGIDGKKMSKRHGATAASEYRELGYLPEAMRNYLLRLGFSHGDDEIISDENAIKWFDFAHVGKSPARFDFKKLDNLNAHYLRAKPDQELFIYLQSKLGQLSELEEIRIKALLAEIKIRAHSLNDLVGAVSFIRDDFDFMSSVTDKAKKAINDAKEHKEKIIEFIESLGDFSHDALYEACKGFAESNEIKMKVLAGFLRATLTASHISPSIFEIMKVLEKKETLFRIKSNS